jgi:hypothetical protein
MLGSVPDVVVQLDQDATLQEVEEVEEAVRSSGLVGEVRVQPAQELGPPPEEQIGNGIFWTVVVAAVGMPLSAFITGLAGKAGGEAYEALRSFVAKLRAGRRSSSAPDGWVEFEDSEGTRLMIGEPAEEAFDKLRQMALEARRGERLRWDEYTREWVPY